MADLRARALRKNLTDAERKLWHALRTLDQDGTHFRKQAPIGAYVVDFVCHKSKLVIEIDGGQHGEDGEAHHDEARTMWLGTRGYRVIRFWNNEVLGNLDGVITVIIEALKPPTPIPSPQGGGVLLRHGLATNSSPPPCGEGMGVGGFPSGGADA